MTPPRLPWFDFVKLNEKDLELISALQRADEASRQTYIAFTLCEILRVLNSVDRNTDNIEGNTRPER